MKKYLLFALLCGVISCYPIEYRNSNKLKDETRYPNGTVIGKYTYVDEEGTPIHVKYYADDSSYGVELKSVKTNNDSLTEWKSEYISTSKSSNPFSIEYNFPVGTNTTKQHEGSQIKEDKKLYKSVKSDFDTFYSKDLMGSGQRQKDKIRVYLDNEKRIIRDALNNLSL